MRESWLLTKPEVSKITVIEKHKEVIDYHQHIKSPFLKDIEIIHGDATSYVGSCDTLLIDHYEFEKIGIIVRNVSTIQKNISCERLWFWPLEWFLSLYGFGLYNILREKLRLPDLTKNELQTYCKVYSRIF